VSKEIGIVGSSYLYWRFESGGNAGIAYGTRFSSGVTIPTTAVAATSTIPQFEIDSMTGSASSHNLVFTTGAGSLSVVTNGGSSPTVLTGGPATCDAVASYSNNVWCLSAGSLYEWSTFSPTVPTIRFTGQTTIPLRRFAADSSYFYFVRDPGTPNGASIQRMLRSSTDGGATPPLTDLVLSQTNPTALRLHSSSYLLWLNTDTSGLSALNASFNSGGTVYNPIPAIANLKLLAVDTSSSTVWGAILPPGGNDGQILRATTTSLGTPPTTVVKGIKGLQGFTVDSSYIYWTQTDGRVYRRLKSGI